MSRVLLLCPEPLGHGHPAGVGIRFLEFCRALSAEGHRVTLLTPDGAVVPGINGLPLDPPHIASESARADVAIVQGHVSNDFFAHATRIPTVIDLYDPFIVENFNYYPTHGQQVYDHDHLTLTNALRRGDLFLCASSAQRLFYLGMLLGARRLDARLAIADPSLESLIRLVPFGVPPVSDPPKKTLSSPRLLFGGIYDWYDPELAIEAVRRARNVIPGITLTFTRHPNPDITPQGRAAKAMELVRKSRYDFVSFEPWVPYDERREYYDRFTAAMLTFPQSLETDLAMRTRIFDDLWAGLPVISSSAPGTDEILESYDAGIVVDGDDPESFAKAIEELLRSQAAYDQRVAGALRYAEEHQWSRLMEPLLQFCRKPVFSATRIDDQQLPAAAVRASLARRLMRRVGGLF